MKYKRMSMEYLQIKLVETNARVPSKHDRLSAGYDLHSSEKTIVEKNSWKLVSIGISIKMPEGVYGRIAPRSGLSLKGICIGAGVIDPSYRGVIKAVIYNHSDIDFEIEIGDRICQLILEKIKIPQIIVVDSIDETNRGSNGFGSSGI